MATAISTSAVAQMHAATAQADVAEKVRAAHDASQALYPVGGGTSLDFGPTAAQPGQNLDLTVLDCVVDYTPRDMTILLEAGVKMADLAATLDAEGQVLPIDVPRAADATIGGVVATNWSGPRRYGHGTMRDYVIGIHAVDGRGTPFKGGGRVVKNVAGYDFCKLLTGSLGTLAVVTQLALKVKPKPELSAAVVGGFADMAAVERALEGLALLETPPVAIDLLVGKGWTAADGASAQLAVRLEGTEQEIAWLVEAVLRGMTIAGSGACHRLADAESDALWQRQVEFSDRGVTESDDGSPMVMKISVPPSAVVGVVQGLLAVDANCTIQAHAGNGILMVRFSEFRQEQVSKVLVANLRPAAIRLWGSLVIVKSKLEGLTPHLIWGGRTDQTVLLEQIKRQFDPRGILNPGRFVF